MLNRKLYLYLFFVLIFQCVFQSYINFLYEYCKCWWGTCAKIAKRRLNIYLMTLDNKFDQQANVVWKFHSLKRWSVKIIGGLRLRSYFGVLFQIGISKDPNFEHFRLLCNHHYLPHHSPLLVRHPIPKRYVKTLTDLCITILNSRTNDWNEEIK